MTIRWPSRRVPHRAFIGLLVLVALAGTSWNAAARQLQSPFAGAPSLAGPPSGPAPCGMPPEAVRDIRIETAFVRGDYTTVDPERAIARKAATAPLHAYLGAIVKMSDEAMRSTGQARSGRQACVERWLSAWAETDALFGEVSWPEGAYERKWMLTALSLAYLKMYGRDLPAKPPAVIERWLRRLAEQVVGEYSGPALKRNNHYYWAGLAAAAAATVIDDPPIYAWGQTQYDLGTAAIRVDGSLPLELARGPLALYYHVYSASPLSLLLAFRGANGAAKQELPLRRLVGLIVRGLSDPAVFADLTGGVRQTWWQGGAPDGRTLAWLEAYRAVTGDPASDTWIARHRPLGIVWLGGDMTHAIGRPIASGKTEPSPLPVP